MLVVQGAFTTAVVRARAGEPVVLLSGELLDALTPKRLKELHNLAAAILTEEELSLFRERMAGLRCGEMFNEHTIEVGGAVLTIYQG